MKNEAYKQTQSGVDGKKHISFSEFSLYQGCPHKHLIQKYLKLDEDGPSIHLYFGNAVHEAFELALRDKMPIEERVVHFRNKFRKEMLDNMKDHPDIHELENFLAQGENIIRTFPTDKVEDKYEIVSVEEDLYEKIHGIYHFKGFIDLVVRNKKTGRYKMIDWKTSGEEWNLFWKLKDNIFLCQMRFYKFFWARKHGIPLNQIDCDYVVLNRLKNKKKPDRGFGKPQNVPINSTEYQIQESLKLLAHTVKSIHLEEDFPKIKVIGDEKKGCRFCKYKEGDHPLCNSNPNQYKSILAENREK